MCIVVSNDTVTSLAVQDFNIRILSFLYNHSIMGREENDLVNLLILSSTCPLAGMERARQYVAVKGLTRRFSSDQSWLGESSSARGSRSVGSAWESSIMDKHSSAEMLYTNCAIIKGLLKTENHRHCAVSKSQGFGGVHSVTLLWLMN